jgi:fructuronate reductase
MKRLGNATMDLLPAAVQRPQFDRAKLRTGIVHLGVGAFHRAHQAVFTDDCLNAGDMAWGITAASLRQPDTHDALAPQDGLYTLSLRQNESQTLRVVGSIGQILVAPQDPQALIAAMTNPDVRIVSMTITEKGYAADVATGDLRLDDPSIQHDLAHPDTPRTALGLLMQALRQRRAAGHKPFAVLSCDNLPENGHLLQRVLGQFAHAQDPVLAQFIADEVACPSCMVDRIVPATTAADRTAISARLGLLDAWPVVAEPFFQWVIEDNFPGGRPEWERSGVEFVSNVAPYEAMKLRLLNGAHTTIAAMGRVSGYQTVADAMQDPVIRAFLAAYWAEVTPTIAPGIDVPDYTRRLLARFDNTVLHHKTAQITTDASLKVPQRIIAPLRALVAMGRPAPLLSFALAAWIRSCEGTDQTGAAMPMNDPRLQAWSARPGPDASALDTVRAFTSHEPVFGQQGLDPASTLFLQQALSDIRKLGLLPAAALRLSRSA